MARAPVAELILYACPHGPLADALDRYYAAARDTCGANQAHAYPAHVTLTGFFHDSIWAVRDHVDAVAAAVAAAGPAPSPAAEVGEMVLRPDFHFLAVVSPWFESVARGFHDRTPPTPTRAVRLKQQLHVSLAYGFDPPDHEPLAALARGAVDPSLPCEWTIRLYERLSGRAGPTWVPHGVWPCEGAAGRLGG